jgi:hypothetical protein
LNDAIIFTTPNVAADSNGFFHPLGDHAQVSYVIDGQPISDQRNKVFSTSIPENAIQSMELISGSPAAEYGDKTSLVVNANTRSGLGQKPSGSFLAHYGSFGTIGEEATLGAGTAHSGNFAVLNTERTGTIPRHAGVPADPRRGQHRHVLRSNRFSAHWQGFVPPGFAGSSKLDADPEHL